MSHAPQKVLPGWPSGLLLDAVMSLAPLSLAAAQAVLANKAGVRTAKATYRIVYSNEIIPRP